MRSVSFFLFLLSIPASLLRADETGGANPTPIRVGVLSESAEPAKNTSQALYIRILNEAGMEAGPVSAEAVKAGALEKLDIFIIGGGSGSAFNKSLGPDGGAKVEAFVKAGGGVLGSCAGGYSFVRGHNEFYRKYGNNPMEVDAARWVVRGKLGAEEKIDYRTVFPSMRPQADRK